MLFAMLRPVALALLLPACGSSVNIDDSTPGGEGGEGSGGSSGSAGNPGIPGVDGGEGGFAPYVDPGCPEVIPPVIDEDCSPFTQNCPAGYACDPYVVYPSEPCSAEIYGSQCVFAGTGVQGDPCNGPTDCSAGYNCVVTGAGTQCIEICDVSGPGDCAPGLVCEPIDVGGIGGCF